MTYIVNNARLSMYADDHQLYVAGNSVEYVEQSLNDEGQTISRWYGDNFLKGNYDKYDAMLINRGNNSDQFINVNIDGYTISLPQTSNCSGLHWMISLNSVNM